VRVVSLVPSLTEAVAVTDPGVLVGCTDWCTHPDDLDARGVVRVRGTKNPDVEAVVALRPDLVVANEEENRAVDLGLLRAAGLEVLVTDVRTVPQALVELERVLAACGLSRPRWLDDAEKAWAAPDPVLDDRRLTAVVPIWRRPWMAVGSDTFAGDVLARLGVDHVLSGSAERYPRFEPEELPRLDLVVLPDEPYRFTADDGPEAFAAPSALVDGRSLTWYGPAMVQAPERLVAALRAPLPAR
jgi:ABC-type Fe3+-hydroxamate transport system substrate-binding protein